MNKFLFSFLFLFLLFSFNPKSQPINYPRASDQTILLARSLSQGIFELNGVPYLQPMVETVNATSNSRFFSSAYLHKGDRNLYVKISVNGMYGIVPESKKTYTPQLPMEKSPEDITEIYNIASRYGRLFIDPSTPSGFRYELTDTAGLIYYAFKTLLYEGVTKGMINVPKKAPTILGKGQESLVIPHDTLLKLIEENTLFNAFSDYIPLEFLDSIKKYIAGFPEVFDLPSGANISRIIAGIPQLEFGSLYGTELLLRFIPPIDLGKDIGKFAFWGIGIRHCLSQYIDKPLFDFAIQLGYQGTRLTNIVGVTNAELSANANFFNANFNISKKVTKGIELFSGFSYETLSINADYTYYLPRNIQWRLGLIRLLDDKGDNDPSNDVFDKINGDPFGAMVKNVIVSDKNFKWTIGAVFNAKPFSLIVDYSVSKFNVFSLGLMYEINFSGNR